MRKAVVLFALTLMSIAACVPSARAEDLSGQVKKVVEKSTLDQPGTKPFHLKADYAPSLDRDKGSNRTGQIEIWWESPTRWRREVTSPEFRQILIVDGAHQWQKNGGDYFPDWLREIAVAIVRPVPIPMDVLLQRVKAGQIRRLAKQTNIDWDPINSTGDEQANGKGYLSFYEETGLLFYTGGPGWNGQYHDFKDFHGRMIARTVSSGHVEVTAKVSVLEDLGPTPDGFFNANAPGSDSQAIDTVVLSEGELRKSLLPSKPIEWPTVDQGPFEGVVWTEVVIDRAGKIREMIPPIADNPRLKDAADAAFHAMQFQPVLRDGVPVQATGRITVSFKTTRPAGMENFDSARNYFERGRKASFLAAGATAPYLLKAEFQIGTPDGVQTGRYEDTWISATEWKREAWLASSHLVKSHSGDKYYMMAEGPLSGMLRSIMMFLEPIPASDTMTESDWRIRRDTVNGVNAIRVSRGPEGQNGELDPANSQGYWFDETGQLIKSHSSGLDITLSEVQSYGGVQVARRIQVSKDGKLGAIITLKDITPADSATGKSFKLSGHEWQRAFTAEER